MADGWSHVTVAGQPALLFEPGGSERPVRFALLWLHSQIDGIGEPLGLTPWNALATLSAKHRLACLAPLANQSWWVGETEKHLLSDVVPWMEERWKLPARAIAAAGIEMGGQGAVRLGLKHPSLFRAVASVGGAIDFHELHGRGTPLDDLYESRERCRQDIATLHMHPSEWPPYIWFACDPADPWFRGNDRLNEKLRAYGVPHTADLENTGPDYVERMLEPMLKFLADGLDRESRRLM